MSKDQIAAAKLISATAYRVVGDLLKTGLLKPAQQSKANARCQALLRNNPEWGYDELYNHCFDAYEQRDNPEADGDWSRPSQQRHLVDCHNCNEPFECLVPGPQWNQGEPWCVSCTEAAQR